MTVGAGIAGPTMAYWLLRTGHEVTLVERAPQLRRGGYLVDFWGAGFDVAERMGIVPELRRRGYPLREARAVDQNGHRIASLRPSAIMGASQRYVSIARSDLAAVIYEALDTSAELILNDSVHALVDGGDRVRLALAQRVEAMALGVVGGAVQLVDREHDLPGRSPELTGDGGVRLRHAESGVGQVQHHVRLLGGHPSLEGYEGLEADLRAGLHPAGVDQRELVTSPLGPVVRPVARRAGLVGDDRPAPAQNTIHERALANVRRTDDGDHGEPGEPAHCLVVRRVCSSRRA